MEVDFHFELFYHSFWAGCSDKFSDDPFEFGEKAFHCPSETVPCSFTPFFIAVSALSLQCVFLSAAGRSQGWSSFSALSWG